MNAPFDYKALLRSRTGLFGAVSGRGGNWPQRSTEDGTVESDNAFGLCPGRSSSFAGLLRSSVCPPVFLPLSERWGPASSWRALLLLRGGPCTTGSLRAGVRALAERCRALTWLVWPGMEVGPRVRLTSGYAMCVGRE